MVADDEPVPLQLAFPTSPGQDGDLVGLAAHAVHGGASLEMVADDEPIAFQLAFPTSPG